MTSEEINSIIDMIYEISLVAAFIQTIIGRKLALYQTMSHR